MGGVDEPSDWAPPPDPTERTWRHPSEIASAQAHQARLEREASTREARTRSAESRDQVAASNPVPRRMTSRMAGVAAASVAAAGLLVGVTAFARDDAPAPSNSSLITAISLDDPGSDGEFDSAAGDSAAGDTIGATTNEDPAENGIEESITTSSASLSRPATSPPPRGVLTLTDALNRPVGTAIALDGVIVTSATLVDAAGPDLGINLDGTRWPLEVTGLDDYSDIALLTADAAAPVQWGQVTSFGSLGPGEQVAVRVGELGELASNDSASEDPAKSEGTVLSVNGRAATTAGHPLLNVFHTSCVRPPTSAGAAIVKPNGDIVGIVVDHDGQLATALPIKQAIAVGKELQRSGWAHPSWLGVELHSTGEALLVTSVEPEGPAAVAGVEAGDQLLTLGIHALTDSTDIVAALRSVEPADVLTVRVLRQPVPEVAETATAANETTSTEAAIAVSDLPQELQLEVVIGSRAALTAEPALVGFTS